MNLPREPISRWLATLLFGLAPFTAFAQGSPLLRVEMPSFATVQQSRVALGAVAYLSSPDLQLLRRAMALPVGQAPRVGESTVLDQERLLGWVNARLGIPAEKVRWEGSTSTVVRSASSELTGESLVALAQPVLLHHLNTLVREKGLQDARIELNPVSVPASVSIPMGDAEFSVRPLSANVPGKRMLVWVDVFADKRHVKAIPVRFEVSVFANAAIATRSIGPGGAISADDTLRREVDFAHLISKSGTEGLATLPLGPQSSPLPHARNGVRAGAVITSGQVRPAPAVSRGDRATLVAHSGLVSLESRVEVLQAGDVGQVVRVRSASGTAAVMAKVIGPGQLELQQ